jgi:aldose 1-epimerase
VLFVPRGKDFFAVEPVSHANDGFNLLARGVPGSGVQVLEPGAALGGTVRLEIAA